MHNSRIVILTCASPLERQTPRFNTENTQKEKNTSPFLTINPLTLHSAQHTAYHPVPEAAQQQQDYPNHPPPEQHQKNQQHQQQQ